VGVGPILAYLHTLGKVRFESTTDKEVIDAFKQMVVNEGVIPALESSHAIAQAKKEASTAGTDKSILISLSGRGDKDIFTIADALGDEKWKQFIRNKADEL